MQRLKTYLENLNACNNALEWAGNRKTSKAAWLSCPRADWLLWLAEEIEIDINLIILAACDVAESVLHFVPEDEDRPRKAIETTRAFMAGKATKQEVRAAAWTADTAYAAARAARAAARAARVAASAARVAASNAAVYAAAEAGCDSAWVEKQKQLADIVLQRIPWEMWKEKYNIQVLL